MERDPAIRLQAQELIGTSPEGLKTSAPTAAPPDQAWKLQVPCRLMARATLSSGDRVSSRRKSNSI